MISPALPVSVLRLPVLVVAAAAMLAGCAREESKYPSLAPRPIEKLNFAEPEAPPPAPVAADPALDASIAAIAKRLDTVTAGFAGDSAKATTAARAAKGKPVGSDSWLEAQSALAGLDDWRAQASAIVTDLDQLASDRAAGLAPAYPSIGPLRDRAQAETDREGDAIRQLQDALPAA